jgi:catechol 2,3-dioxygenase-like lactoylglutathione lyase family enzyme
VTADDTTSAAPQLTVTTVNIGAPDPAALAHFYVDLLGWQIGREEPGYVIIRNPADGLALSFQQEEHHVPPVWPAEPGDQQMMMHLEIRAEDLDSAVAHALKCGAVLADFQPQQDVRVCLDPAGHPFCLWVAT